MQMPTGLAGWADEGCERKIGVKDDFEVFSQSNEEDWNAINFDGKQILGEIVSQYWTH